MIRAVWDRECLCEVCQRNRAEEIYYRSLVCANCWRVLAGVVQKQENFTQEIEGMISPLRSKLEIQMAHDVLMQVLADADLRRRIIPDELLQAQMAMCAATLCWVLGHDHTHGKNVDELLKTLKLAFLAAGCETAPLV